MDDRLDVHVYLHDEHSGNAHRKLDQILARLGVLERQENSTMATVQNVRDSINALQTAVANETTVEQSVLALVTGLAGTIASLKQQLADAIAAGSDPAALQDIVDQLGTASALIGANADTLSKAVVDNTPAAPPAPSV